MRSPLLILLICSFPVIGFTSQTPEFKSPDSFLDAVAIENEGPCEWLSDKIAACCDLSPKWYLEGKVGYTYLTDASMRQFFDNGGISYRVELGYQAYKPLYVWLDGGYFQKEGKAIGGNEYTQMKLATITLGLKGIFHLHDRFAFYLGAGPRVFMLMMHNDSPYVRGDDNAIHIGGGFSGGFWIFPFPSKRFFIDLFTDYSLKTMKIEEDEISSYDYDINVSGLTAGLGIGFKF